MPSQPSSSRRRRSGASSGRGAVLGDKVSNDLRARVQALRALHGINATGDMDGAIPSGSSSHAGTNATPVGVNNVRSATTPSTSTSSSVNSELDAPVVPLVSLVCISSECCSTSLPCFLVRGANSTRLTVARTRLPGHNLHRHLQRKCLLRPNLMYKMGAQRLTC